MIIGQTERVFLQGYIWDGMLFADEAIHSTRRVNLKNFSSKNSYGMWIGIFFRVNVYFWSGWLLLLCGGVGGVWDTIFSAVFIYLWLLKTDLDPLKH